ncbi:MAG TPA: VanZ family protein [Candidatus Thermoplasmatota archaeon]|nr:VanZ family protein [Candidatus Thermoplasmatota archaeon]
MNSYVVFVCALLVATSLFLAPLPQPSGQAGVPLDKLVHIAVLAVLGVLARRAFAARHPGALYAALVAYAAFIELAQAALPWRAAEVADLVAGAVGALAVFLPKEAPR